MPIMIVEDNLVSAKLVEGLLQKAGHQTVTAKNGKEALELLPTICNVQIILTDYLMPEMNGLEFIQHLKMLPGSRTSRSSFFQRIAISPPSRPCEDWTAECCSSNR